MYCSLNSNGNDQRWEGLLAKLSEVWDKDVIFGMCTGNSSF